MRAYQTVVLQLVFLLTGLLTGYWVGSAFSETFMTSTAGPAAVTTPNTQPDTAAVSPLPPLNTDAVKIRPEQPLRSEFSSLIQGLVQQPTPTKWLSTTGLSAKPMSTGAPGAVWMMSPTTTVSGNNWPPRLMKPLTTTGLSPIIHLPVNTTTLMKTPLMQQALHDANPAALASTMDQFPVKGNSAASNQPVAEVAVSEANGRTTRYNNGTWPDKALVVPLVKVPRWMWIIFALVFVGISLLTFSGTLWILQQIWQKKAQRVTPTSSTLSVPTSEPTNYSDIAVSTNSTIQPHDSAEEITSPGTVAPSLAPSPKQGYATVPSLRQARQYARQLLSPAPQSTQDVLWQWVTLVQYQRR